MHVFYSTLISGTKAELGEEESLHLSKVLRLREGDPVAVMDGKGGYYEGVIGVVHAKKSVIVELRLMSDWPKRTYNLHVAIAPTKMMERFEWFLEKAVEIGVDRITPLLTRRTERNVVKMNRMEKIVLAAMKQSKTPVFPTLDELIDFESFCRQPDLPVSRFIAHCMPGGKPYLTTLANQKPEICVLIGPEGDFTPEELALALNQKFQPVSLGESRLRAETAGIIVCAQIQSLWQIQGR